MGTSLWRFAGELVLLFVVAWAPLQAATLILADFDNTVVETRQERRGIFRTFFKVFLVDRKVTVLEPEISEERELVLSPWDFERLKPYFSEREDKSWAVSKQFVLQDGRKIRAGHYRIRYPESFEYFSAGKNGRNHLLDDFVDSETRTAEGTFRGPLWAPLEAILSDAHWARNLGFLTARDHTKIEWGQLFDHWKSKNYFLNSPNLDLVFGVGGNAFERFSLKGEVAKQKLGILETAAYEMGSIPLTAEDEKLSADGKSRQRLHTFVFADDNQETLELVLRKFQHLAQSKTLKIKFCVFNMGKATDIRESRRPQYSVILSDGTFRPATRLEILGEPTRLSPEMEKFIADDKPEGCREVFEN